jgi:VWFA-related protein
MRRRIRGTLVCLGVLALSVEVMRSQAPQNSQENTAATTSAAQAPQSQSTGKSALQASGQACATPACDTAQGTAPVIRTITRLVQVSVVVTDKKGLPVTGLKKEDFTILDGGQAQKIEVFSGEMPVTASQPPRTLPPNIFTNRHDKLGEPPGSKSIILLDALNTVPADQEYAREQALKFLKTIQPQDHFAVYTLVGQSQAVILHEFTQDDTALVRAIKEFNPKQPDTNVMPFTSPMDFPGLPSPVMPMVPEDLATPGGTRDPQILREQQAAEFMRMRTYPLVSALIQVANHVASIPGRKNLIWISGGLPRSARNQQLPDKVRLADLGYRLGEPKYAETQDQLMRAVTESCNAANVVLYGVGIHGLQLAGGADPSRRSMPGAGSSLIARPGRELSAAEGRMDAEQNLRDTDRMLADGTGGTAFYGNNDIAEGMTKAFDDGRYAYMIGYYPDHKTWDGKFRKIQVKVNQEGAHVRSRDGYYATQEIAGTEDPEKQMQFAAASPLDSSALSMMVSGQHVQPPTKRDLDFQVGVDVAQLLLRHTDGHWKGGIDLMFVQKDEKTAVLAAEKKHIDLDFTDAQYQDMQTRGAIFERHLALVTEAREVRVVMRDAGSGQIGTVSVPLRRFFPEDTGAGNLKAKPPRGFL